MTEVLIRPETGIDAVADAVARLVSLRPEEVARSPRGSSETNEDRVALVAEIARQEGLMLLRVVVDGYEDEISEDPRLAADLSKFLDAPVYAWIKPDGWNDALAEFVNGTQTRVIDVEDEDD